MQKTAISFCCVAVPCQINAEGFLSLRCRHRRLSPNTHPRGHFSMGTPLTISPKNKERRGLYARSWWAKVFTPVRGGRTGTSTSSIGFAGDVWGYTCLLCSHLSTPETKRPHMGQAHQSTACLSCMSDMEHQHSTLTSAAGGPPGAALGPRPASREPCAGWSWTQTGPSAWPRTRQWARSRVPVAAAAAGAVVGEAADICAATTFPGYCR